MSLAEALRESSHHLEEDRAMGRIEVRERRVTEGLVTLGTGLCVAVALGLLVSARGGPDQPSGQDLARQEAAARQQADLDRAWRPWVTGAENLMVVTLCVIVPCGIAGLGLSGARVLVRRWRPLGWHPSGNRRVPGDPPQPQMWDGWASRPAATGQGTVTSEPEGELWWPTVA
jgi:hypothetical protein